MNTSKFLSIAILCLFVAGLFFGPLPLSSAADEPAPPQTAQPAAQMTAEDVGAFLDGIIPQQLDRENIAGATVAVVKDGKLLFAKGYGYADVEKRQPVVADKTLFRPGSVSKLFTWTAVMQLQEQGKLDLNRDVNEYLDFKIPDAFGEPITLKHILTHTAGFEEQVKDLFSNVDSPNLGDYVKTHIPTRIFRPGTTPAYSNYATALAGYIVERVSGQPFSQYVDQHIFKPLAMNSSSFEQPLPGALAPNMSKGYRLGSGDPLPFEVVTAFPAGSLSSSATDMAQFMLAHLQDGKLGEAQILKPETARLMHSRLFGLDDAAPGMAHGFYEESQNGLRIIGHGGDTIAFHSDLHLVLEKGVGFFISYNSGGKGEASSRTMIWDAFLDRYYPYKIPDFPADDASADIKAIGGNYMISRRSEKSFLRIAAILGEDSVIPNSDGSISVATFKDPNGLPKRWKRVAPMTFRDVNGEDVLVFKPDSEGTMQMVLPYPFMVFKRVGLWESSSILLPVLLFSLGIMALTLILTPIAWLVRRHYGGRLELGPGEQWPRRAVWLVFALNLASVIGIAALTTFAFTNIDFFGDKGKPWFWLFQILAILGAIGSLLVIWNAVKASMSSHRRIWGKLMATVLALACFGFLWFAIVTNLLIPRSTY